MLLAAGAADGGRGRDVVLRRLPIALALLFLTIPAYAQTPPVAPPDTREQAIAADRVEKLASLWPERQNAMVDLVNGLVERGLKEGLDSGLGANGIQFLLGGMRAAQGVSGGVGYRRSDLLREHLGYRVTARGTVHAAYMLDFAVDFKGIYAERTSLQWYTKFEHSPQIDYYGPGNTSAKSSRSSYRYDDFFSDFSAAFAPVRSLRLGLTGGYIHAQTAESGESGVPPIEEAFPPAELQGFGEDTHFTRAGGFAYFDSRDSQTGPRRGGLYGVQYRAYWDVDRTAFAFRQSEIEVQQYLPYFNRGRVLAFRAAIVISFPNAGDTVPMYLQPTLGGNDELRGFAPYRFRDYHSVSLGLEHRWYVSSFLDMALFADAGKVVPLKREIDATHLHYSGGIGFRLRAHSAVITRFDIAASDEGVRFICTFSDIFSRRF